MYFNVCNCSTKYIVILIFSAMTLANFIVKITISYFPLMFALRAILVFGEVVISWGTN